MRIRSFTAYSTTPPPEKFLEFQCCYPGDGEWGENLFAWYGSSVPLPKMWRRTRSSCGHIGSNLTSFAWMMLHKMRSAMVNPQVTERGSGGRLVLRPRATSYSAVTRQSAPRDVAVVDVEIRGAATVALQQIIQGASSAPCIRSLLANVVMRLGRHRSLRASCHVFSISASCRVRPAAGHPFTKTNYLDGRSGATDAFNEWA